MFYRIWWGVITIFYYPFFKKIYFPSYIGVPIVTSGLNRVIINKRVRILPGLRMETYNKGSIIIEENVSIGQNFHITSAGNLLIGSNSTILGNTFITNIDHDYQEIGIHVLEQDFKVSETKIGKNCFIGYGVAIQAGTILGYQCVVGANSVVRGVFPDYSVIVGVPAKVVKRYNLETKTWERTNPDGSFFKKN